MSVLIKGLNLKPCKDGVDGKGLVIIGYDDKLYFVSHEQIIPLPDHGDLIDRDSLKTHLGITDWECEKCEWYDRHELFCKADLGNACLSIENAEAVIPAERSEE